MKRTFTLIAVLFAATAAQAQLSNISANNRLELWVEDSLRATSYLNQLDLIYIGEKWQIGARLEMDEETWWDPERTTDIVRRYAEYQDESFGLRGGTFYTTFGRGLTLRAMEDEDVRVDRDIDGVWGSVTYKNLDAQALVGRMRNDRNSGRPNLLSGLDADYRLTPCLTLGGSYVRRDAESLPDDEELEQLGRPATEEAAGGRLQLTKGILDLYVEGAQRFRRGNDDVRGGWTGTTADDGHAWYGSLTLGVSGYSLFLEGKDYQDYDVPYSTLPPVNVAGQPINNGLDEQGFAAVLAGSPSADLTFELSGSYAEAEKELGERSATSGTVRKDWWGKGSLKLGGEWTEEVELESHTLREYAGPTFDASLYVSEESSLSLHSKILSWKNHYRGQELDEYTEVTADLTLALGPNRAFTFSVLKASEEIGEYDNEDVWLSGTLNLMFGYDRELMIKVGDERGGIVCSSGVCVYEPPFSGVRVEFISRF